MTSSTSSKSNIWCNLCASVKGAGLAAADAELPCLLLLPRVLGFSMCVLSAAAALCFALARRSVGVAEGDSGGGGRGGRSWDDDIWSMEWPSFRLFRRGRARNSLWSDKTLRCCLPGAVLSSCGVSVRL